MSEALFGVNKETQLIFKNIVAAPHFHGIQQVRRVVKYLYKGVVFFIARGAGLGSGRPEVKPSTSEPLPVRLRELAGKLGWMNWEPVSLAGCLCEGRRSRYHEGAFSGSEQAS